VSSLASALIGQSSATAAPGTAQDAIAATVNRLHIGANFRPGARLLGGSGRGDSVNRSPRGNRPELFDAVAADADVPVIKVDGRVAMAGHQAELVADVKPVGGAGDGEAPVLVGSALVGGGGFVPDTGRAESKARAFNPASTIARSSLGRLITVAQTKRLCSNALVGAPSRSRLRP